MADAAQARSDAASRNDEIRLVKPELHELCIPGPTGMMPFKYLAEPEVALDQAFALLKCLELAWTADRETGSINEMRSLNSTTHARALEGVSNLVALASHGVALMRFEAGGR